MRLGKVPPALSEGQRLYVAGTAEKCRIKIHSPDKKALYCNHVHTLNDLEKYYSSASATRACPKCGDVKKCEHVVPSHFAAKCKNTAMINGCYVCHVKSAFANKRDALMPIGQGWDWLWDWDPLDFLDPRGNVDDVMEEAKIKYAELLRTRNKEEMAEEANAIIALQQAEIENVMDTTLSPDERKTVKSFLSDIEIEHLPPLDIMLQIVHELDDPADIKAFWKVVVIWYNRKGVQMKMDARTFYILYTEILRVTFPLTDDNYVRKNFPFMFADSELFSSILSKDESPDRVVTRDVIRMHSDDILNRDLDWPEYKAEFKKGKMKYKYESYIYSANKPIILFEMSKYLRQWISDVIMIDGKRQTILSLVMDSYKRINVIYDLKDQLLLSLLDDVDIIKNIMNTRTDTKFHKNITANYRKTGKKWLKTNEYNIWDCVIYSQAFDIVNEPTFFQHRDLFYMDIFPDQVDALFRIARKSIEKAKEITLIFILLCLTRSSLQPPADKKERMLKMPFTPQHEIFIKKYMADITTDTFFKYPAVFGVLYDLWTQFVVKYNVEP